MKRGSIVFIAVITAFMVAGIAKYAYAQGPTIVASVKTPGTAYGVYVADSYAYVTDKESGLYVIHVCTTKPTVSSTTPLSNATDVGVNTAVSATFSEVMDASTITTDTFLLNYGSTSTAGTVIYSGTTATFTPAAALDYNTTYIPTITTGAKDLAGNALEADYMWSFTPEPATDGEDGGGGGCFISVTNGN